MSGIAYLRKKAQLGNRCGHNPAALRTCDVVKRGRGGQHQVLGIVSAYLGQAAKQQKARLKTWHNMNESGRSRRSEIREAMASVTQFLFAKEYQLDSRRCAKREGKIIKCVDIELVAKQISQSKKWNQGEQLSEARARSVIRDFKRCGYITLSKQQRTQRQTGEWQASPKVITFTKLFFLELGGKKLWRKIQKVSTERVNIFKSHLSDDVKEQAIKLAEYFKLNCVLSPRQITSRPPDTLMSAS